MHIFIKLFKPAPKDDSLLNMLCDNAVHLSVDNQSTQLLYRRDEQFRQKARLASQSHVSFTQLLADKMTTINVMCGTKLKDGMTDETWDNFANEIHALGAPMARATYDATRLKVTLDEKGDHMIDLMNPDALQQFIFMKEQNDAFSSENPYQLIGSLPLFRTKTALVSGFFAERCIKATSNGALKKGVQTIIDPQYCYDEKHLVSRTRLASFKENAWSAIITEPGQVAHVMAHARQASPLIRPAYQPLFRT